MPSLLDLQTRRKQEAADAAIRHVKDGMAVGLGTGTTSHVMIAALARKVKAEGLQIRAIPTSEASAAQATSLGIPLTNFVQDPLLDLAIDGADEVHRGSLTLVKGRGGALLREKIVAAAAKRFIVIVDDSKLVNTLGSRMPLPIEVNVWGWERVQSLLISQLGALSALPRTCDGGDLYLTDNQNLILDCRFESLLDATSLAEKISAITGVVDHGLFIGMASEVLVAGADGVTSLTL